MLVYKVQSFLFRAHSILIISQIYKILYNLKIELLCIISFDLSNNLTYKSRYFLSHYIDEITKTHIPSKQRALDENSAFFSYIMMPER